MLLLFLACGLSAQPLVLSPRLEQIPCGETVRFQAQGWEPGTLHWQADRGKVDEQGLFTAPAEPGPCTISATDWQNVNRTVSLRIQAVAISLRAPAECYLHPREESRILVQLEFRGGEYGRKLLWRMAGREGGGDPGAADGQVDATGWVRAPSAEGSYPIEIALADDPRIRTTVRLQVVKAKQGQVNAQGEAVRVLIRPAKAEIRSGEYQSFTAQLTGLDFQKVSWTLQGNQKDADLDSEGIFRASAPGTYRLRATSFEYPECWGEAEVIVAPSISGLLKPEDAPEEDLVGSTLVQAGSDAYLLLGGWNGKRASTRVLRLDLSSKGLRPSLSLQVPRTRCLAARLTDGTLLVTGGIGNDGRSSLRDAERVDPERRVSWKVGSARWAHIGGVLQALPDGRALLIGGCEPDGRPCGAEVFTAASAAFKVLDERPWPSHSAAVSLKSGQVLILGGESNHQPVALMWRFDPGVDSFTPLGRLEQARSRCTATLIEDEREVIVVGGRGAHGTLASVERIDLATGAAHPGGRMAAPREGHAALLLPTGQILLFGGGEGPRASRLLEDWNPDENGCQVRDQLESGAWLPFLSLQPDGSTFVSGLAATALGKVPLPPAWEVWN